MKYKLTLAICLMMLSAIDSIAQDNINGIYLTNDDFLNNVLTNAKPTDEQNWIELKLNRIYVHRNGEQTKYKFGSLAGYVNSGQKYRAYRKRKIFSDYGYYQILDTVGLTLYNKKSSHHRSTGKIWYYYSSNQTSPIKRMTRRNITRDFADNPAFIKAVTPILDKDDLSIEEINRIYNETKTGM